MLPISVGFTPLCEVSADAFLRFCCHARTAFGTCGVDLATYVAGQ
jgi:hypothetical protein